MNFYLVFILTVLIGGWLLELAVEMLNLRHRSPEPPEEFAGMIDEGKYRKMGRYLRDRTGFGLVSSGTTTVLTVVFILAGGFNLADRWARVPGWGEVPTGLLFAGILVVLAALVRLPFSYYGTFVIEEKYGFNRSTRRVFFGDLAKGLLLAALIGGAVFALVIRLFETAGPIAWLWCWAAVSAFQLFLVFIAPVTILPLFNKFTPLPEGEVRSAIEEWAAGEKLKLKGIFVMDASRRSTKTNAFFTGLGKSRRIVLFDTLMEKHNVEELLAVLAHELGHWRRGHILKMTALNAASAAVMFYLLSLFIGNAGLFAAFRMENISIYASIFFFAFLYAPIESVLGIGKSWLSRRHEYAADRYSVRSAGGPEGLISALKKLSVENFSHLNPHPLKVFLSYSHPPILERIRALKKEAPAADPASAS